MKGRDEEPMKSKPRAPAPSPLKHEATQESLRVEQRFRELLSMSVAVFSQHTTDGVLQGIVDGARAVVGARYAALGVLAPDGKSLLTFVTSGIDEQHRARIGEPPHGRGLLGLVIKQAKPIRTADIARHAEQCGFPPHHPLMHSFLGVPIKMGRSVFGNLYFTDKIGAREFDAEDEGIAVLIAMQAAAAVESARLLEQGNRLLRELRDLQRQRDLFFAMMNHELRNALTGVYGWAERLVRPRTADGMAQAANEVFEGTERTISLLNNFLDLTRLDSGKVRPVWREVDAREAAQRALTGFEPAAEAKHLVLAVDAKPSVSFRTDPVRLQQILVNLLSNAVRHSPAGARVLLAVRPNGSTIQFLVADEGPGVPPEALERIFEPFERFDPHSGAGTGLGLPVSRRLAEVLGGHLEVQSASTQGATFILELPIHPPA